jgi:DNA primase
VIPDDEVTRIREAADIVGVIGEFVELRRMGADFRGPCPFHQGTHKNFSVSPRKHMYYCFVCHESGDVFSFVQKRLGLEWPDAVRHVAAKSGLELREVRRRPEGPDPRTPLWEANAAAAAYFQRVLWDEERGAAAREYLAQRAISRSVADHFQLGFSPNEIGLMRAHLATLGIDDRQQLDAGLLMRRSEEEEPRPRFRQRLMFPIHDLSGRCIGFGGRVIGSGEPKYLNSAETAAFSKGHTLYNLHHAKLAMRKDERAFIVEGYFDVVRLVAAGVEPVVAPLGTALTDEQAQLVTRYTKNVLLLYDSDQAGLKATFRAGDALLRHGASVRVVSLPAGEDPDTFVRSQGAAGLEREVERSIDVFERKIQILERGGWFGDLQRRRRAIDHLLPTLRATAEPVMRDLYLARASEASGVERGVLQHEVEAPAAGRSARVGRSAAPAAAPSPPVPTEPPPRVPGKFGSAGAEKMLVHAMLLSRPQVERVAERLGPGSFREPLYRELFTILLELGESGSVEAIAARLSPSGIKVLEDLLAQPDAILDVEQSVDDAIRALERIRLETRNKEIDDLIRVASEEEKNALLMEKTGNQREISRLSDGR